MHRGMAVDAWLQAMRLVSVYMRAGAPVYCSRCMRLVSVYSRADAQWFVSRFMA